MLRGKTERGKDMRAYEIFKKEYGNSKNIMTQNVLEWVKVGNDLVVELSSGRGLENEPIFGVTVISYDKDYNTTRERTLSQLFSSEEDAREYIAGLR